MRLRARRTAQSLLVVAVCAAALWWTRGGDPWLREVEPPRASSARESTPGDSAVEDAFRKHRSNVWVEASGLVDKTLSDDRKGSRHQRFIIRLPSGHTVLVAHNIDLAERVPVRVGDPVSLRGEYEWNELGGVVHWTHRDPQGRRAGGHILHGGRTYR